jgi:hypothetical protein
MFTEKRLRKTVGGLNRLRLAHQRAIRSALEENGFVGNQKVWIRKLDHSKNYDLGLFI